MSCFQCDLDIPHVCYEGVRRARWGWTDEAVATLEAAQRNGFLRGGAPLPRATVKKTKTKTTTTRRAP